MLQTSIKNIHQNDNELREINSNFKDELLKK